MSGSQQVQADSRFQRKDLRTNCPNFGDGFPGPCVFGCLEGGSQSIPVPPPWFLNEIFFLKTMARIQVVFLLHIFFGIKNCPENFCQTRFFFVAAGGLNGFDVVFPRWLASFRHMELTHNENDICMPVPRTFKGRQGFVCFFCCEKL